MLLISGFTVGLFSFYLIKYLVSGYYESDPIQYLDNYQGENFPPKYLVPEDVTPTLEDVHFYMKNLKHLTNHCMKTPNNTDANQGLSFYFMKAVLKRSLKDYGHKIDGSAKRNIKTLINKAEHIISHYVYKNKPYGIKDLEFRVSSMFADDEPQVYSIKKFNRHRLLVWLLSKSNMHKFIRDMDTLNLPKERYAELSCGLEGYFMHIQDSDICLSRIVYNPAPIDLSEWRACSTSRRCRRVMFKAPSIGYSLSHRMLNIMMYRFEMRCYIQSPDRDMEEMEQMCAFMYREAVYIARRGFFARDLFLEHVALCSMLGYEEFHRRSWYYAITKWIDENGCIQEHPNFALNHTKLLRNNIRDPIKAKKVYTLHRKRILEKCHTHPMALLKIVLAHAIRYSLHFLPAFSSWLTTWSRPLSDLSSLSWKDALRDLIMAKKSDTLASANMLDALQYLGNFTRMRTFCLMIFQT